MSVCECYVGSNDVMKARGITEIPDENTILDTLVVMQEDKWKKRSREGNITKKNMPSA